MSNTAEYTLKLHGEGFSKGLHDAKGHADALHHSMQHLKEIVGEVVAAYYGFEVLKESLIEFEKHKVAVASLSQMYKNNSEYIKENIEQLKELAEIQEKTTGFHSEDTMQAEQNLMKFRDIKISYEELIPVIEDFASATKTDAADAANTLGRALENPQRAMRLLMQAGIGPNQLEFIRNLQKAGKTAEAQAAIFDALKDKYQGMAKAAFEANPLAQIEIQFKETKETIGEFEDKLLLHLMPAIKGTFEYVRELVHWMERNKGILKEVLFVVGEVISAYIAYNVIQKAVAAWEAILTVNIASKNLVMQFANGFTLALAEGMDVLTASQVGLNIAMTANPIGAVITAILALGAAVYGLIQHYETLKREYAEEMHARTDRAMKQEINTVEQLRTKYERLGMSRDEATKAAIRFERNELEKDERDINARLKKAHDSAEFQKKRWAGMGLSMMPGVNFASEDQERELAFKAQLADIGAKKEALEGFNKQKLGAHTQGKGDELFKGIKSSPDKVGGTQHTIINVTIGKLIGIDKFIGTSKQVVMEAGEQAEKLLLGAVNQFQASID